MTDAGLIVVEGPRKHCDFAVLALSREPSMRPVGRKLRYPLRKHRKLARDNSAEPVAAKHSNDNDRQQRSNEHLLEFRFAVLVCAYVLRYDKTDISHLAHAHVQTIGGFL